MDDITVADVMLVECDALRWLAQQPGKPGFAHLDRQPAQVLAVEKRHRRLRFKQTAFDLNGDRQLAGRIETTHRRLYRSMRR